MLRARAGGRRRHGVALAAVAAAAMVVLAAWPVCAADTFRDPQLGFTFEVPGGFEPEHQPVFDLPGILCTFSRPATGEGQIKTFLFIKRLKGVIGPERMSPELAPPHVKLTTTRWQGYVLDVFEVSETVDGVAILTCNVQVPLKKAAVQLSVVGPAEQGPELARLRDLALQGLKGESNWTRAAPPVVGLRVDRYGYVLMGIAAVAVIGGLVGFWILSKKTPKGATLAVAAFMYAASYPADAIALGEALQREKALVVGTLRLLGFMGCILGLIDVIRKRKTLAPQPATGGLPASAPTQGAAGADGTGGQDLTGAKGSDRAG